MCAHARHDVVSPPCAQRCRRLPDTARRSLLRRNVAPDATSGSLLRRFVATDVASGSLLRRNLATTNLAVDVGVDDQTSCGVKNYRHG
jgi:hypothetical protein